jgi:hypothetical protein
MIRKAFVFTWILLLFSAAGSQGSDKYDEAANLLKHYLPALEKYLGTVEKTGDPGDMARAINQLADSLEDLAPKMKKLSEKYPELEAEQTVPARYAGLKTRTEALGQRFFQSFTRIMPFLEHPEVKKANGRLMGIMASMGGA